MSRESESEREERKILPTFKWDEVTFLFEWGFYILKEGNKMAEVDAIFPPFFTFSSVRARPLNGQQLYVEIFPDPKLLMTALSIFKIPIK